MTTTLSLDDIPGPRGLPVLGNVRDLDADAPFESLMRLADEFGPIYKLSTPVGLRVVGVPRVRRSRVVGLAGRRPRVVRSSAVPPKDAHHAVGPTVAQRSSAMLSTPRGRSYRGLLVKDSLLPQARERRSWPAGLQARDRRSSATAGHLLTVTGPAGELRTSSRTLQRLSESLSLPADLDH